MFSSCKGYQKLLKSTDSELKFEKALEYYKKDDFVRASTLLEQIMYVYKGTDKDEQINFLRAKSYYGLRNYIEAGYYFKNFASSFPKSKNIEEAEFLHAHCYYIISPEASLDQANTHNAINAFQLFIVKYPNNFRIKECYALIDELMNKLVHKSYINAKLYFDLSEYKSSIIALRNSLNEFPDTQYREELMFLLLKSNYLLADNSVVAKRIERFQNTVDEYYFFIGEFPESKYIKDAEKIYNSSIKVLNSQKLNQITKINNGL